MAKRVLDRRALRAQGEAAERRETELEDKDSDTTAGDDEGDGKKKKKTAKAKVKSPAKPRAKRSSKANVRMRVVWTVFNNSSQAVAKYDYPRKAEADAHAERLKKEKNITHFVMPVKEQMEVAEEE
jgi:hypothetical protein